jgi:chromosomal replication initiator protein
MSIAEGLVNNTRISRPQHLTSKQVISTVANYYQLQVKDVLSADRSSHIKTPRQIAMYLIREELNMSFPKIAKEFNKKDHTTVMNAMRRIENDIKLNFLVREQIAELKDRLYAR